MFDQCFHGLFLILKKKTMVIKTAGNKIESWKKDNET